MKYYSVIKNNEFMKFLGKWMYLEYIILSEVTQSHTHAYTHTHTHTHTHTKQKQKQKNTLYVLTDK
jgi:ABC-type nickel/cobalt efflux system permease component RcnA